MFAIKSYYTAGHAEINAFGDTNLCVSTGNASCFDELGTYQAKTGRDVIHPSKKRIARIQIWMFDEVTDR